MKSCYEVMMFRCKGYFCYGKALDCIKQGDSLWPFVEYGFR